MPNLPVGAVMVLCPLVASLILITSERGSAGIAPHLKRALDLRLIERKVWYAPILLLMPATAMLAYISMRVLDVPLPVPAMSVSIVPALFVLFFLAAVAEELGWSGYVLDPLQNRWGALLASLMLGLVWAAWHVVPLLQVGRAPAADVSEPRVALRSAHHRNHPVDHRCIGHACIGAANARAIYEAVKFPAAIDWHSARRR